MRYTVDSHYLEFQGTLLNTSRYPYLDIWDLQNWGKIIGTTTFNKYICNWTLDVRDILKILWKRGEMFGAISPLFHKMFFCLLLDVHVSARTRFSLRDKRLFEISEFKITGVNCICLTKIICPVIWYLFSSYSRQFLYNTGGLVYKYAEM